jgi:hypothetical protein
VAVQATTTDGDLIRAEEAVAGILVAKLVTLRLQEIEDPKAMTLLAPASADRNDNAATDHSGRGGMALSS